ncbi:hypothetical protein IAU59_002895 [Kwoniella sp. CBS 9459]
MLHAASPSPASASPDPPIATARQSPAASFFSRLNAPRSTSFDGGLEVDASSPSGAGLGFSSYADVNGAGPGPSTTAASDLRRATSLRTAGVFGGGGRETVSFTAAGSDLSSPSVGGPYVYTPPAASRHPLFSHHALPPGGSSGAPSSISDNAPSSPHFLSDPGPSGPPSPTPSDISSSAFSPASAFLSAFASSNSLRAPSNIAPDAAGARVLEYTLGKIVGRGGFSTVRKATQVTTGGVMACKIVKRDDLSDRSGSLEKFEDEIRLWKALPAHASLLPLIEMHRTPYATFLIMPYLPGGSLLDVLQREGGSDKTARTWFPGVVAAVSALHEGFPGFEGGVLHGDLKLDNFLVDHSGGVMVCDFYMAQKITGPGKEDRLAVPSIPPPLTSDRSHSRGRKHDNSPLGRHSTLPAGYHRGPRMSSPLPGSRSHRAPNEHSMPDQIPLSHSEKPFPSASLPYAPPELLRAPPSGPSLAQDVWAVGIILYALLTSKLPFVDAFDPRLQMKILRGTWEEPAFLTREWAECLHGCLDGNRDTRWTIGRVKQSDAITGWKEVQSRSKSRSRSRARVPGGDGFLDPRRRMSQDGGTQAVPISPFPRGRNRKHSTSSSTGDHNSRSRSRSVYQSGTDGFPLENHRDRGGRDGHRDVFAPLAPTTLRADFRAGSKTPRSRSASASRSRSSGNDHRPMFTLDAPDLVRSLEGVDISRGRSVKRDMIPGLPYARQSSEVSANVSGLPIPGSQGYPNSKSNSRSRSRQRLPLTMQPSSAPAYPVSLSTFGSSSFSTFNSGLPSPSPRGTSASRSSRTSESPSASRGGRSMSRSRDSPPVWDNHLMLDRYEYGKELELVHEEDRGRTGRSRSRGRRGRPGAPGP